MEYGQQYQAGAALRAVSKEEIEALQAHRLRSGMVGPTRTFMLRALLTT